MAALSALVSIVLLHSALGLRPSIRADAELLRANGHHVVTPDLYQGAVFGDVDAGMDFLAAVGREAVTKRALTAVDQLGRGVVYAGYSMGAGIAQSVLEDRRDGAGGLFLCNANAPRRTPLPTPVQVHAAVDDEWVSNDAAAQLAAAGAEVFRYAGGHLFTDPELRDFDARSAELMWARILVFLDSL